MILWDSNDTSQKLDFEKSSDKKAILQKIIINIFHFKLGTEISILSSLAKNEQYKKITIIPPRKINKIETINHWLINLLIKTPITPEKITKLKHRKIGCKEK